MVSTQSKLKRTISIYRCVFMVINKESRHKKKVEPNLMYTKGQQINPSFISEVYKRLDVLLPRSI